MKKVIAISTIVGLMSTIAGAELVGSLHLHDGQATNDFYSVTGLKTRTGGGEANTRGAIEGAFSCLPGSETNVLNNSEIKVWSSSTPLLNVSRYSGYDGRGLCVWDFDLTGLASNKWVLKLDYEGRRNDDSPDDLFISFNGLGRTLDTTDISTLSRGDGDALVSDVSKYVHIGQLPTNTTAGVNMYNLTDIVEAAIENDGKVRVVYSMTGYYDDLTLLNDSGLISTNVAAGDPVSIDTFFIAETFENGSGILPFNGWTSNGPESKEYNTNNTAEAGSVVDATGMLVIQEVNGDERDTGTLHNGYYDSVFKKFDALKFATVGDSAQLMFDIGILAGTSTNDPALEDGGEYGFTFYLNDTTATTNAGYGMSLARGRYGSANYREYLESFNYQNDPYYGGYNKTAPTNGTMETMIFTMERIEEGMLFTSKLGAKVFNTYTNSNPDIINNSFDEFGITLNRGDGVLKLDNVFLIANSAPLSPYERWYEFYGIGEGENGFADDPDGDGVDNMHEWALGGNPADPTDTALSPYMGVDGDNWVYAFPSNSLVTNFSYTVISTPDLVNTSWTTNAVISGADVHSDHSDYMAVTNLVPMNGQDQGFVQVLVEEK